MGQAKDEVDSAVDRVEDPTHCIACAGRGAALLPQDGVVGTDRGDPLPQPALCQSVHVGDQVGHGALRVYAMTPLRMRRNQRSSTGGQISGKITETGDQLVAAFRGLAGFTHRTIAPRA